VIYRLLLFLKGFPSFPSRAGLHEIRSSACSHVRNARKRNPAPVMTALYGSKEDKCTLAFRRVTLEWLAEEVEEDIREDIDIT